MKAYAYNAYTLDASVYCVTCGLGPETNGAQRVYNCGPLSRHRERAPAGTAGNNAFKQPITTIPIEIKEIPTRA